MDTPLPRDKASANADDFEPGSYPEQEPAAEPSSDDSSVLHADQLTVEDEIPERRPMPRRTKLVLLAVAAVVLIVGAIAAVQTLGRSPADAVLGAGDVVKTSVEGENGAATDVAVSADRNAAVVTFRNLPAPGNGQVYQLWKIPANGSAPVSVGSLSSGNISGEEPAVVENISGYKAAALTLEARGGAQSPTPPFTLELKLAE